MPIKIADGLSAKEKLHEEGIYTIDQARATHQDIRPLRLLILNLMPLKKPTELQLLRLLGNTPLQVEVDFCHTVTHAAAHTDASYLEENYCTFDDVKDKYYDGMIITGAPVETLPFDEVDYWPELVTYFDWAKTHVFSTLFLCWGAQAALYHYYGIQKLLLSKKFFGIYEYQLTVRNHPLLRGFDDRYFIPSRAIRLLMMQQSTQIQPSKFFPGPLNMAIMLSARQTTVVSSYSDISSMTAGLWKENTCGIRIKDCLLICQSIIIRTMMI